MQNRSEPVAQITHPCDSWARAAGHKNWASAMAAFNEGKVLAGPVTSIQLSHKSAIGMKMFMDEVDKEGLHTCVADDGSIFVGRHENFPTDLLATQHKRYREMHARFGN